MKTWTLRRNGEFWAKPTGPAHCGIGDTKFRYECWVTCSALDSMGFVIDNKTIVDCVPNDRDIFLSCERAGEEIAANVLKRMDPKIRPYVSRIKVMVGPAEIPADSTFEWERDGIDEPRLAKDFTPEKAVKNLLKAVRPRHSRRKTSMGATRV